MQYKIDIFQKLQEDWQKFKTIEELATTWTIFWVAAER